MADDYRVEKICKRKDCEISFSAKVHNQTFCSPECCRVHTNERILQQYHDKKNKKMTGRVCASKDCGTLLSRYNPEPLCAKCDEKKHRDKLRDWGWPVDESEYS